MSGKERNLVFELRYLGETVGWATLSEHGCVLEAANEDTDALVVHRMRGIVEWLVQDAAFAA
jgi:hypothetical protein